METRLLHVLRLIRSGTSKFEPRDGTPEEVKRFQPIANAVMHAKDMGYIRDAISIVDACSGQRYFTAVITTGGLTYHGEEALADEIGPGTLIEELVDEISASDNMTALRNNWDRAIERSRNDPMGSITAANSFLESVMKWIVEQSGQPVPENRRKLFELTVKLVSDGLPGQDSDIVGHFDTIMREIGSLRSKIGDAHGSTSAKRPPSSSQAMLSVNLAGSLALYLLDSFDEQNR
ncbi:abortive infection family protein [Stenotrophomonas maltophilia group sp. CASM26]|uniref:abortive infection family protein n=1 Tax=Stenotrophomonas maltophilia group sp. CASM26 TaxID=3111514 RepID=UPI003BF7DC37